MTRGPPPLASAPVANAVRTIAFFGHDRHDSAIRKRIAAFETHGSRVLRFMFRRERPHAEDGAQDGTIDLGITRDLNYARRLLKLAAAVPRILAWRRELRACDVFYARNLDMLALAALASRLAGARAPLVYEALDVRRVFIGRSLMSRLFRFAERRLLAATDVLVVSSPDYMTRYFWPVQGYAGAWRLIENKLGGMPCDKPPVDQALAPGPPWVIGWFGVLKCRRSLEILARIAAALGDRVEIHIRGFVAESEIPASRVAELCDRHRNIVLGGPYANPADLPAIYGRVHITWAADFLDPDANSTWCLPNRLYEGAAHGSVLLAKSGTATGARIERDRLGWTLAEPLEETAPAFIDALTPEAYSAARASVQDTPPELLHDLSDTAELLRFLDTIARRGRRSTALDQAPGRPASAAGSEP